ncbi:MAG TPA: hypothetical protein P5572_07985 [Phycisphaerae bacterium]|nr:hypothetical protein [Phycisphaerales bacterium]HRX84942.1 hypothetical protein [Phycisphaerae bacterium]
MLVIRPQLASRRRLMSSLQPLTAVLAVLLLVAGAFGGAMTRSGLAEYEVKGEWVGYEELASHVSPRRHERHQHRHSWRTTPESPSASAGDLSAGRPRPGHRRPLNDAHRQRNGFGGPLLT